MIRIGVVQAICRYLIGTGQMQNPPRCSSVCNCIERFRKLNGTRESASVDEDEVRKFVECEIACGIVDRAHAEVILLGGVIRHRTRKERSPHSIFIEDDRSFELRSQLSSQSTFAGGGQAREEYPGCRYSHLLISQCLHRFET